MTMPGQFVFRRIHAMLWTGSNGADIADLYTSLDTDPGTYSVISEVAGEQLFLRSTNAATGMVLGQRTVFATRPWVVIDQTSGVIANISDAAYQARFVRGAEAGNEGIGGFDLPYFGEGVGMAASSIGIGATVNIDVQVSPAIPGDKLTSVFSRSQILATSGVNLTTTTVAATPTIQQSFAPASVVNGVVIPAYSLIRTKVKNSGLTLLSSVQIKTTVFTAS